LLSLSALSVVDRDTSATVNPTGYSYDPGTNTATFTFSGVLPDGNYRATLDATKVKDSSGNVMSSNFTLDFFSFNGDANHDGTVDFNDLVVLAQNYNTTGKTFSQG